MNITCKFPTSMGEVVLSEETVLQVCATAKNAPITIQNRHGNSTAIGFITDANYLGEYIIVDGILWDQNWGYSIGGLEVQSPFLSEITLSVEGVVK